MTFEEWYDQEMQTSAFMRELNPAREFAKGVWQSAHAEGRRVQRDRDADICEQVAGKLKLVGDSIGGNAAHDCMAAIRSDTGDKPSIGEKVIEGLDGLKDVLERGEKIEDHYRVDTVPREGDEDHPGVGVPFNQEPR